MRTIQQASLSDLFFISAYRKYIRGELTNVLAWSLQKYILDIQSLKDYGFTPAPVKKAGQA